jgi:hypothetical protein
MFECCSPFAPLRFDMCGLMRDFECVRLSVVDGGEDCGGGHRESHENKSCTADEVGHDLDPFAFVVSPLQ